VIQLLTWILKEIEFESGDWIKLAQDMDQKRAVVNAVMNFCVS
jgi:hypothetical protein